MADYSLIHMRLTGGANRAKRSEIFDPVLKRCVLQTLGDAWKVELSDLDDDGPLWKVTIPGTAKPLGSSPQDPPAMVAAGEDIGFPVVARATSIAFRHCWNMFVDWAQGRVAEEISQYYGHGIYFESTDRTQRAGKKEYRTGKTFRDFLMRKWDVKDMTEEDKAFIESFSKFAPPGHW
jgi:hypothetical protein